MFTRLVSFLFIKFVFVLCNNLKMLAPQKFHTFFQKIFSFKTKPLENQQIISSGGIANPTVGNENASGGIANRIGGIENASGGIANPIGGIENAGGGIANPIGGIENAGGGIENRIGGIANTTGGIANPIAGNKNSKDESPNLTSKI